MATFPLMSGEVWLCGECLPADPTMVCLVSMFGFYMLLHVAFLGEMTVTEGALISFHLHVDLSHMATHTRCLRERTLADRTHVYLQE